MCSFPVCSLRSTQKKFYWVLDNVQQTCYNINKKTGNSGPGEGGGRNEKKWFTVCQEHHDHCAYRCIMRLDIYVSRTVR